MKVFKLSSDYIALLNVAIDGRGDRNDPARDTLLDKEELKLSPKEVRRPQKGSTDWTKQTDDSSRRRDYKESFLDEQEELKLSPKEVQLISFFTSFLPSLSFFDVLSFLIHYRLDEVRFQPRQRLRQVDEKMILSRKTLCLRS